MEDDGNHKTGSDQAQLRALLAAMEAAHQGDFSRRVPVSGTHPLLDRIAETFNAGAERFVLLTREVTRVSREVGVEGRLGSLVDVPDASGAWRQLVDGVNVLASSFTVQVRDLIRVSGAVARGDLTQTLEVDVRGESLELKTLVNTMVERLTDFAREVNRVARQVGVEGASTDTGASGVWKDLTDNMSFTEKLAVASRHKSEFLANISHELRTPLNSLLILAKVLSEDSDHRLGPREAEYARTIHASGVDLLDLINDLLDLSKVEAGKLEVVAEEVSLAEVKSLVERDFEHVADQKRLGFGVVLSGGLPRSLRTDSMRLRQVLRNLLSNAFKFTDVGRVELRVAPVAKGLFHFESDVLNRAEAVLAFSVADTGIGIPQDKLQRIFEAFQQAEADTSRKYGGTGLGLSISRELARLLGGELQVASELGRGSTFTLYLPDVYVGAEVGGRDAVVEAGVGSPLHLEAMELSATDFAGGSREDAESEVAGWEPVDSREALMRQEALLERPTRHRVLVVDDNIREVFSLISVLESRGLESFHAESMGEALRVLWDSPEVDGVVLLVPMTDAGYDVLRTMRKDARFGALPIVVVASQLTDEERGRCLAAGASDYVARPVDAHRIMELLRLEPRLGRS
ncbi:hybrid sensor histidine kinase/response regulator [Myxococcus sp. AS-1-15]|uniref:ATP-binding response regulator n=1 Tax=Myxococcus sp. AS-1-15 TaxID=2874600 RepID=UPI001CBBA279|nr:ATP-binding protein [Myxococcus sp. AS-1-15]MBZ4401790.1 response regulator [Myxococcus sp. AS-1-15]